MDWLVGETVGLLLVGFCSLASAVSTLLVAASH